MRFVIFTEEILDVTLLDGVLYLQFCVLSIFVCVAWGYDSSYAVVSY